ncbi:MAG TPA: hypothetical protein PLJ21_08915 [Pseudobdellovibrionaceae bacterium]|nr:hypothetical protein [Pseudobdellovibrionaceae bacterium]
MGIHDLDFISENKDHRADSHLNIPKDILKSTTVENLISQNDDLMARLKVTLRRLSTLEIENQKLHEQAQNSHLNQSAVTDQMLVYKEKDQILRNKIDHLERDKEKLYFTNQNLEKLSHKTKIDLERYKRYHEKVRTQVKPYLNELKEYSLNLEKQVAQLEAQLNQKETQIKELREQMGEVSKNARFQVELQQKQLEESVHNYETEIQKLEEKLQLYKTVESDLQTTKKSLNNSLERKDELENELILVQRLKEDYIQNLNKDLEKLQDRVSELSRQNQKLGIEHADLQIRTVENQEVIGHLKTENSQLKEQLESLRIMWNAKNDEVDKIKTASKALERLNLELSKEINSLRHV